MSDSDLFNRNNTEEQEEASQETEAVETEDILTSPLSDPYGRIKPPSQISSQVTVLEGLQNLGYPAKTPRDQLAEIREEHSGTLTVLNSENGSAIYTDPEWGEISGRIFKRESGESFFAADNCLIDSAPERIGDGAIILSGAYLGPEVKIGPETLIGVGTQLRGNIDIGASCKILSGARLSGGYSEDQALTIGDRTTVGAESRIGPGSAPGSYRMSIGSDVQIGERTSLKGSAEIGNNVSIGVNCALEVASVASGVEVGKNCTVNGGKLPQSTITRSLKDFSFVA